MCERRRSKHCRPPWRQLGTLARSLLLVVASSATGCADFTRAPDVVPVQRDTGPWQLGDQGDAVDWSAPELSPAEAIAFLERSPDTHLRVATYNIWWNSIFESAESEARFTRVVRAIDADVWALQEVWAPIDNVARLFDRVVPLSDGQRWQAVYAGSRVTVSRYPILRHHWETDPTCGKKVSLDLIDLPDQAFVQDLYVVHPGFTPFEGTAQDSARQCEADQVISWLRGLTDPLGPVGLAAGTPIVIAGDLNMVGSRRPLMTLLEGDIVDEARFGPDYAPDWDGTPLTDAEPLHNGVGPETWTWRSDRSRWQPGRLDFILYSDSVMRLTNAFVLNTASLSHDALERAGLRRLDVALEELEDGGIAFDHIPVVADFALP
jgi:endonuclease/exonuclease/phosphatase family metal-dependent hydrolase